MEISLGDLRDLLCKKEEQENKPADTSLKVGTAYLFRSVTHYYVGRIKTITATDIVLEQASWVADTGRFYDALKTGDLNEVEPFPDTDDAVIFRAPLIDASVWNFKLPQEQK